MNRPRLEDTGRGLTVFADNRYLYSKYDPEKRPKITAETAPVESKCIYFIPSPLLGYGLGDLAERIPDDSMILAIEYSQEVMAVCTPEMQTDLISNPKIKYVRLSDIHALHAVLQGIGPWKFRRVRRLDFSGGASLNPALYDELADFLLRDLTTYWRNRHAMGRLGRQWTRHILANLAGAASGSSRFKSMSNLKITGLPVVAGAGPSLESALPFIRRNRRNLWILAADTALPALISAGIRPDAAAVLETQAWNLLDFHNSRDSGIPVIGDITAYPPSLIHTGGPCFLFSSEYAELEFLRRLDQSRLRQSIIPPLGSVGLAALEIAMKQSRGPILLTGLDFAYRPGKSHARGSSFHQWQISVSNRLNPLPGWEASMKRPRMSLPGASGTPMSTDIVLQGYAAILKDRYSDSGRMHVLEPGGLELGLPLVDESEAENLITRCKAVEDSDTGAADSTPGTVAASQVSSRSAELFLDDEVRRLNLVLENWDRYASGLCGPEEVVNALSDMDEVFSDFPDEPPLPKNDDSFLVRAVVRCRQMLRFLERVRNQESSSSVRSTERKAD